MLKQKVGSFIPLISAVFFVLLVVYLFSQDASLAGPF